MSEITTANWSESAASNNAAPPNGWPEGQQPSSVNDCARETHAALKRWWNRDHASANVTVGGTANAVTLTYSQGPVAYVQGEKFAFKATAANTGATTVNVNGLGATNVFRKRPAAAPGACSGGEWQAGDLVELEHDGTQFILMSSPAPTGGTAGQVLTSGGAGVAPSYASQKSALMWSTAVALTAGTTSFIGPGGASSSEGPVLVSVPYSGTIRNLFVNLSGQPGAGKNYVLTFRKNLVDQAVTVTLTGASQSTGNDTTHSFSVTAGDLISIKVVTDAAANSLFVLCSFELDSP